MSKIKVKCELVKEDNATQPVASMDFGSEFEPATEDDLAQGFAQQELPERETGPMRDILSMGLMVTGGVVGAGSPTPGGALIGSSLGYAAGEQAADLYYQYFDEQDDQKIIDALA